jgi:hypothetical protein
VEKREALSLTSWFNTLRNVFNQSFFASRTESVVASRTESVVPALRLGHPLDASRQGKTEMTLPAQNVPLSELL